MNLQFNEAIYFFPLDSDSKHRAYELFLKAYAFQLKGDLDQAVSYYQESLRTHPTAEAHTFLGWTYSSVGMYAEAIEECYRAIATDPEFGNPYNDIGAYLIELGQLDEAIPWLEKAIQAKRYESYHFPHFNLGRIWERKGEWYRAIAAYREALRFNPAYATADRAMRQLQALLN